MRAKRQPLTRLLALLVGAVCFTAAAPLRARAQEQPPAGASEAQLRRARNLIKAALAARTSFDPARKLLREKGVPFDPDELLHPRWAKRLAPVFERMPEMQTVRRGGPKIKGVIIAHTLYLPEKVEPAGDTVIIVRNLIHEGRNVKISGGRGSLYVYPIERVGLLGMSLQEAFKQSPVELDGISHTSPLRRFALPPLTQDGERTLDEPRADANTALDANARNLEGEQTCGNISCDTGKQPFVVVDVDGDGFDLTSAEGGVSFDLNGDGSSERLSWTATDSDDAWLALDRDGDGLIEDGTELFGNFTYQRAVKDRNGFLALKEFDYPSAGGAGRDGNGDGVINRADGVFSMLLLWRDANHNGVSEADELSPLSAAGVEAIELDYKESKRTDEHGNRFRYRAKVRDARGEDVGRWAWDVFLVRGQ